MNYFTLTLGDYQTNTYLVYDKEKNCAVIDPGYEAETIWKKAEQEGLKIHAILLTHGHFDHVGAVKALAQKAACPVWIHEQELKLPPYLTAGVLYYTDLYSDVGSILNVEGLRFRILETPGHTMGSVCLLCGEVLFSGDTLFAGSCGRTDLGGNTSMILESLKRLAALPGDYTVCPGHGGETTLNYERRYNPYLR